MEVALDCFVRAAKNFSKLFAGQKEMFGDCTSLSFEERDSFKFSCIRKADLGLLIEKS